MDEIYVKAFVSFIIGALVYNLIDSMKLCNNLVEGQEVTGTCIVNQGASVRVNEAVCTTRNTEETCRPPLGEGVDHECIWNPVETGAVPPILEGGPVTPSSTPLDEIIADINNKLFLSKRSFTLFEFDTLK